MAGKAKKAPASAMHAATEAARAQGGPKKRASERLVQRSYYLPPQTARRLKIQASIEGRSQSDLLEAALVAYFAAHPLPGYAA